MDWTEGYTAEVEYTVGFYRELAPIQIYFAALLQGVRCPDPSKPFTYFEIGCGQGLSTNMNAALYPKGQFFANDFNPAHIRNARALASQAGLSNVRFLEKSFAELLDEPDLPEFDFITLHGVYSWITQENRQQIVEFIRRKLKPGGAVYVSYNCQPGWAAMAPVRRLLTEYAARLSGPLHTRMRGAFDFVQTLIDSKANYFQISPFLAAKIEQARKQDINYVAHEYFNKEWNILYSADVAAEMAAAKLNFVGSCAVVEQFERFMVSDERLPLLNAQADPILRETLKDYIANTQFRRDVFIRGATKYQSGAHFAALSTQRFALAVSPQKVDYKAKTPAGEVNLHADTYRPVVELLAAGPKSVADIAAALGKPAADEMRTVFQQLAILAAFNIVLPALPEPEAAQRRAVETLNAVLFEQSQAGEPFMYFGANTIGSGQPVEKLDQMLLATAPRTGELSADQVINVLRSRNQKYIKEGKIVEDWAEAKADIELKLVEFNRDRLPIYRSLGVQLPTLTAPKRAA